MAADGANKRRRRAAAAADLSGDPATGCLQQLLHTGGVSQSGLRDILKILRSAPAGVVEASEHRLSAAYQAQFEGMVCTLKLPLQDGTSFDLEYVDSGILLARLVAECPHLAALYDGHFPKEAQVDTWRLVVAFDEFTPGNKLNVDNRRKCMVMSHSFLNLGQSALSQEACWIPTLVIRASVLHNVVGGWSTVLRLVVRRLLFGPHGLASSGVHLQLPGRTVMLYAKLTNLMSDGDGLRSGLDWKGHASLKPCFKHFNIWKKAPIWLRPDVSITSFQSVTRHKQNSFASRPSHNTDWNQIRHMLDRIPLLMLLAMRLRLLRYDQIARIWCVWVLTNLAGQRPRTPQTWVR